eukprot:TRINITY_DN3203_c0_g1_i1.p2 TRINITY_DN3203_c0_g1~~TRINITY_DN3203_c0_g1_i1.p2  ORF type:complete len:147 (+),score=44.92 TRINITY_DN3203_c0_g1_i1:63-503(+)
MCIRDRRRVHGKLELYFFNQILVLQIQLRHIKAMQNKLIFLSLNFEVFGKVQGVFFRDSTQKYASSINISGWIRNTDRNTVEGIIQGEKSSIEQMKHWLQYTGSPYSKISNTTFTNEKVIEKLDYCLLYTSPSPRDKRQSRMPSSA